MLDENFREMAIAAAKEAGLTEDEARREAQEYMSNPPARAIKEARREEEK